MAIVSGCSEHPGNSVKGRVLPPARSGSNRFVRRLERLCTRRATAVRATSTTAPAERYPGARNISATRDIARTSRACRAIIPPSKDGIPGISRRRCAAPGLMALPAGIPINPLYWWTLPVSNWPPPACKAGALPDELRARNGTGIFWMRGPDSNRRPSGYEPDELTCCSTPHRKRPAGRLGKEVIHDPAIRQGFEARAVAGGDARNRTGSLARRRICNPLPCRPVPSP